MSDQSHNAPASLTSLLCTDVPLDCRVGATAEGHPTQVPYEKVAKFTAINTRTAPLHPFTGKRIEIVVSTLFTKPFISLLLFVWIHFVCVV
jgi:hypothetical protein